jgi:hypothetical protein
VCDLHHHNTQKQLFLFCLSFGGKGKKEFFEEKKDSMVNQFKRTSLLLEWNSSVVSVEVTIFCGDTLNTPRIRACES